MSLFFCFTFEFFLLTVMPSAFTFYVQRLTKPLSEPTGTVFFSGDSRKTESFNTTVQIYAISFLSRSLLLNSRIICSSTPVKRLKPVAFLRQSHYFSPQYLLFTSAPNETASSVSGVPHLIRRPAPKARGTMRFSSAAPFIFSSRSLGGVQLGDQYPNNITIWAWPMKGFKKVGSPGSLICMYCHISTSRRRNYWWIHQVHVRFYSHASFSLKEKTSRLLCRVNVPAFTPSCYLV
ncbi:hypothetical protein N665_0620s0025 [Sinapis alba]|nr:hypothetical protein N665_0620s0025 [Sinapis alba]